MLETVTAVDSGGEDAAHDASEDVSADAGTTDGGAIDTGVDAIDEPDGDLDGGFVEDACDACFGDGPFDDASDAGAFD